MISGPDRVRPSAGPIPYNAGPWLHRLDSEIRNVVPGRLCATVHADREGPVAAPDPLGRDRPETTAVDRAGFLPGRVWQEARLDGSVGTLAVSQPDA